MSNIYLYAHGGSGNHGCEAIVRSTLDLLKDTPFEKKILISSRPNEDIKYGINELCEIEKDIMPYSKNSIEFVRAYLQLKLKNNYIPLDKLDYKKTFDHIQSGDIALSIGGDNYCYADIEKYIMLHEMLLERGAKTILWGCSVEPEVIKRKKVAEDLSKYSYIFARESISYEALKKVNENTFLIPDPAFTLECKVPVLPQNFQVENMVGINISPMIIENESIPGITMESYRELIDYVINETNMGIALIPHVVWSDSDDRKPLMQLYKEYEKTHNGETAHADVIVVDPPRKGCEESLLQTIVDMQPEKVVYVSCDSATLARDVKFLRANGYELKDVTPVDQFPHTVHVEVVCCLHRVNS